MEKNNMKDKNASINQPILDWAKEWTEDTNPPRTFKVPKTTNK